MVREGSFREDLYYRLRVVEVHLPPLRERREDLPSLVEHLLSKITRDQHKRIRYVARDALDLIGRYPWPGNVRELENALTRAAVHTKGEVLEASTLGIHVDDEADEGAAPETDAADEGAAPEADAGGGEPGVFLSLRDVEQRHIAAVLAGTGWNKLRSATILGITRQTLDRKIKDYRIERPAAPPPPSRRS
jgi:DNA-binding NtrC family response regulator